MFHAQNGKVKIDNDDMYYIAFGKGKKNLIMLPGLGDGITTVKGKALPFALMYREFAKKYRVYVFSRRNHLPEEYSSRQMAADVKKVMDILGIQTADVLGVSQGGTIAQYVAIDYPSAVEKLVLTVTYGKVNETIKAVISQWIDSAKAGDYAGFFIDNMEKAYSENYLKKTRLFYPLLTRVAVPKNYDRFITQAQSCLTHDSSALLEQIVCPAFIIGGKQDKIVTPEASVELSKAIPNSQIYFYEEYGHALYDEAKDFQKRVLEFLKK